MGEYIQANRGLLHESAGHLRTLCGRVLKEDAIELDHVPDGVKLCKACFALSPDAVVVGTPVGVAKEHVEFPDGTYTRNPGAKRTYEPDPK